MRICLLGLCLLVCSMYWAEAQIPSNPIGGNPTGLQWQQINTDKVKIIFPAAAEARAQRVARMVHYLWDHHNEAVGEKMIKSPIVLHNQTVVSNGFVTVGPFRSEFFLTSPAFNCATDWLDILTIHEYRHLKQFGNSRRGITRAVKSVMGSWAWGGLTSLALPRWYFEGDATISETALSASGRGRLPAFSMQMRALVLDGVDYGYEKAAAGSLRDFVPNWYHLGYYMLAHARTRYGQEALANTVADAVRYRGIFYPFSRNLQRHTGLSTPALYRESRAVLDSMWLASAKNEHEQDALWNRQPKKTVTDYSSPQYFDENTLVVQKASYQSIPAFYYLYADGREEKITDAGIVASAPESNLSLGKGQLIWSQTAFDERRALQTFSVIKSYSTSARQKQTLSKRSKYFSPAMHPDGDRIVAVSFPPSGECQLVILDADGQLLSRVPNPQNYFYLYPVWAENGEDIIVVGQRSETHALLQINPTGGQYELLSPATAHQLTHPAVGRGVVFFAAAYSGINNIYALRPGESAIYQVTDDRLGAFQPAVSPSGQELVYSSFSRMGFDIRRRAIEPDNWPVYDIPQVAPLPTFAVELAQQSGGSIMNDLPGDVFPVQKFNTLSGLIRPHSWLPELNPPEVGARILSDNTFGTLSADVGAQYNLNEQRWSMDANLRYAELYPVLELGYRYQQRNSSLVNLRPENDSTVILTNYREDWQESKIRGGGSLPLNFSADAVVQTLDVSTHYERTQLEVGPRIDAPNVFRDTIVGAGAAQSFRDFYRPALDDTQLNGLDIRLRYRIFRRQARQNLGPKWGLLSDWRYRTTLGNGNYTGRNLLTRNTLFFPGAFPNHSFFVNLDYQQENILNNYRFPNAFFYPRGYNGQLGSEAFRLGINYSLPLAYPDVAMGSLAFIQRLKANVFFDWGRIQLGPPFDRGSSEGKQDLRSVGVELRSDLRVWRLLDLDIGLRYSYLLNSGFAPQGNPHQFDFLVISISG